MNIYQTTDSQLRSLLGLTHAPIAITFLDHVPDEVPGFGSDYPEPTDDGRTGAVAAGCVFWTKAHDRTFATTPSDHGNCSVGSLTHGLISLEEAATRADVQAVCEAKWVDPEIFPHIPTVTERPQSIVYGPLADATTDPDVVLLRLVGKQAMQLHSAIPSLQFEGKPQCHIIPIAHEQQKPAVSVGCMLSRVRTGMNNNEMTCAIPFAQLSDTMESLEEACAADRLVAEYASSDAARFRE
ncbi:MAG: DUF169 domain-containing protein [Acidiferrobacterales bacterium]|nr:DUF169 domain-containing protein [Acidiferrobacterales bacterium]